MPPGTGDIQLNSISADPSYGGDHRDYTARPSAFADARKGAAMFDKVDVPVIGASGKYELSYLQFTVVQKNIFLVSKGEQKRWLESMALRILAQIPLAY